VKCTVTFSASTSATIATVRLSRGGRTVARGWSRVRAGSARVPLGGELRPGRYTLSVRVTDAGGATTASTTSIRIR
jgi:hypothetical protein